MAICTYIQTLLFEHFADGAEDLFGTLQGGFVQAFTEAASAWNSEVCCKSKRERENSCFYGDLWILFDVLEEFLRLCFPTGSTLDIVPPPSRGLRSTHGDSHRPQIRRVSFSFAKTPNPPHSSAMAEWQERLIISYPKHLESQSGT